MRAILDCWYRGGWVGVDLFFVLSGFLVSGLLFREYALHGRLRIGLFLARRGLKIYPLFWLLLGFTALLEFPEVREAPGRFWAELLFVQNYCAGLWKHTWSLAVEEHFYLLLAFTLTIVVRSGRNLARDQRVVPAIALAFLVGCLMARYAGLFVATVPARTNYFWSHSRLVSLWFGALLSYFWTFRRDTLPAWSVSPKGRRLLIAGGVLPYLAAFIIPVGDPFMNTIGLSILYLGGGALAWAMAQTGTTGRLGRGMAFLGRHSYAIYLCHAPVEKWLAAGFLLKVGSPIRQYVLYFLTYVVGSLGVGVLASVWLDQRILRWRDRWLPSRAGDLRRPAAVRPETESSAAPEAKPPRGLQDLDAPVPR